MSLPRRSGAPSPASGQAHQRSLQFQLLAARYQLAIFRPVHGGRLLRHWANEALLGDRTETCSVFECCANDARAPDKVFGRVREAQTLLASESVSTNIQLEHTSRTRGTNERWSFTPKVATTP